MRHNRTTTAALAMSFAILGACATQPATPPSAHGSMAGSAAFRCTDGLVALYFTEGSPALAPQFASMVGYTVRQATECPGVSLEVVGLPDPSDDSLAGLRAATVLKLLQVFGVREPRFDAGTAEEQAGPFIQFSRQP